MFRISTRLRRLLLHTTKYEEMDGNEWIVRSCVVSSDIFVSISNVYTWVNNVRKGSITWIIYLLDWCCQPIIEHISFNTAIAQLNYINSFLYYIDIIQSYQQIAIQSFNVKYHAYLRLSLLFDLPVIRSDITLLSCLYQKLEHLIFTRK